MRRCGLLLLVLCAASRAWAEEAHLPTGPFTTPKGGQALHEAGGQAPTVESLVEEALGKSAELRSLEAQIQAAEAMVAPAGALPDPMLSVGLKNIPIDAGLRLDRDAMSGLEIMASQEFTRGAKRRLKQQAQGDEVVMLKARYQDRRLALIRDVRKAYLEIGYLDESISIAEQNRDVAADMLAAAEAAYSTGKVMQQDVFQAQVRLSQMLDMLISLQGERSTAQAKLNRLLYRPADQPMPRLGLPAATSLAGLERDGLVSRAEAASPRLAEMGARAHQAETAKALAAAMIQPDYRVDLSYMIREPAGMDAMSGVDMWSAAVAIELPWLRREQTVDSEVRAAEASLSAAQADVEAMRNELAAMIHEMLIEVDRADRQLSLLDSGLLPQAEGGLAASRTAYATGRGEVLDLLESQMNLYQLQTERVMLITEREQNLAELEYLVGGPLPGPSPGRRAGTPGEGQANVQ